MVFSGCSKTKLFDFRTESNGEFDELKRKAHEIAHFFHGLKPANALQDCKRRERPHFNQAHRRHLARKLKLILQ